MRSTISLSRALMVSPVSTSYHAYSRVSKREELTRYVSRRVSRFPESVHVRGIREFEPSALSALTKVSRLRLTAAAAYQLEISQDPMKHTLSRFSSRTYPHVS